ncbi:hypothetical protein WN943_023192 [Citrus x changshan-huyou]
MSIPTTIRTIKTRLSNPSRKYHRFAARITKHDYQIAAKPPPSFTIFQCGSLATTNNTLLVISCIYLVTSLFQPLPLSLELKPKINTGSFPQSQFKPPPELHPQSQPQPQPEFQPQSQPQLQPQSHHNLNLLLNLNPNLIHITKQETPCNEGAAPFEHEAADKANGCETNSFNLSQYSDYVCDLEVEDADDLSEFPSLNDKDGIDLDREVVDPPISQFFKDYLSQPFSEDVILTQDLAS